MRASLCTLLLLSLSSPTLAATNLIPHKPPARLLAQLLPSSHFQDASIIVVAAQCRPGELTCNAGCMPLRGECCPDGLGFCKQGYACVTDGCCPIGKVCSDEITCGIGEVHCGEINCMPEGAVCCPDGAYCQVGEECFQNGFKQYCQRVDGSDNGNGSDGSKTTGGTKTGSISETNSRHQSTTSSKGLGSKTSHEETPASTSAKTSTSTSLQDTFSESESSSSNRFTPVVFPTAPFRPEPSTPSSVTTTTTTTTTSLTSSSATEPSATTSTSGGNAAAMEMPGLSFALVFVSMMIMAL